MAGRPRSIPDDKIFDVSKPGKSKPMGTSRPVIVNHGTLVQDRTVIEKPEEKKQPMGAPSVTRKTITPITGAETPKETVKTNKSSIVVLDSTDENEEPPVEKEDTKVSENTPKEEVTEEVAQTEDPEVEPAIEKETVETEDAAAETPDTTEEVPAETSQTEDIEPPAGSDSANVDALAEASEKKKIDTKEEEERIKRDAALQGLIDSKQYVVPIAHDSGKGGHAGIWILLIIILLAAGSYAAIDSGAVNVNVNLPYHFFKQ